MATYYYNEAATGTIDGTSESTGYDGSTTATMPDGSSATSRINNVVLALQSGDILYVKRNADGSDITWYASVTTATQANDGPTRVQEGYGPVEVIGYGTTVNDGIRANINMGGFTWRFNRRGGHVACLNFKGTYANAGVITVGDGALIERCRIEAANAPCIALGDEGSVDRCELICTESFASSAGNYQNYAVSMYGNDHACISNSYVECQNGAGGIYMRRRAGATSIHGCYINMNLDVDGLGNTDAHAIEAEDAAYNRWVFEGNVIHNANTGMLLNMSGTQDRSASKLFHNIFSTCVKAIDGDDFFNAPTSVGDTPNNNPITCYANTYYANTANNYLNNEWNATFLTEDPFVDVANKDFTMKNPRALTFGLALNNQGASADDHKIRNSLFFHQVPGEISRSF